MHKRLVSTVSLFALIATSCGGGGQQAGDGGDGGRPAGEAQTFTVNVDGKSDDFNLATLAYFPGELSVHPGDTIDFKEVFTGEPHTVTFGKLVDDALAVIDRMGPPPGAGGPPGAGSDGSPAGSGSPSPTSTAGTGGTAGAGGTSGAGGTNEGAGAQPAGPPPEMLKLPDIFAPPPTFAPTNQSAGQPCFLETGDPPSPPNGGAPACPKVDQPEFNGNQTFFNSGYLEEDETFTMKFADDVRPGTYNFICLVHREGMRGKVTVAAADTDIPGPDEVEEKGKQEAKTEEALTKVHENSDKATADKALSGAGSPEAMNALVAEFGPEEVSIPTGGTVTWNVFSFHTIALNAPEDAVGIFTLDGDAVNLNEKASRPAKAPTPPPIVFGPGGKPSTTQATWDGTGFFNSGILAGFPGAEVTYSVRFTKAGTYQLQCTIHPDMEGTVRVG